MNLVYIFTLNKLETTEINSSEGSLCFHLSGECKIGFSKQTIFFLFLLCVCVFFCFFFVLFFLFCFVFAVCLFFQ